MTGLRRLLVQVETPTTIEQPTELPQRRLHYVKPPSIIPPITDPLGRYWEQPDRDAITIEGDIAHMTEKTLRQLKEYSTSVPSGVYGGKMWRRREGPGWLLVWFVDINDTQCSIESRQIQITPNRL